MKTAWDYPYCLFNLHKNAKVTDNICLMFIHFAYYCKYEQKIYVILPPSCHGRHAY